MTKQILVIDDEEMIRESFVLALQGSEYSVETASTGEEGVKKAKERKPDLIFLDLRMAGIDGIETLRQLHNINNDVPVYILTALYTDYLQKLYVLKEEGVVFDVCQKPLDRYEINDVVEAALKND